MNYIKFIETSVFSRQREALLSEDDFRAFQEMLIINPLEGDLIQGTGGCRKVRFAPANSNKGKSGSIRTIFTTVKVVSGFLWLILRAGKTV